MLLPTKARELAANQQYRPIEGGDGAADEASYFELTDAQGNLCLNFTNGDLGDTGSIGAGWSHGGCGRLVDSRIQHFKVFDGITLHTGVFQMAEAGDYFFEIQDEHVNLNYCIQGQSRTRVELGRTSISGIVQAPANCTASYLPRAHGLWRPTKGPWQVLGLRLSVAVFERLRAQIGRAADGGGGGLPGPPEPFFVSAPATPAIMMAARGLVQATGQYPRLELLVQCKAMEVAIQIMDQLNGYKARDIFKAIPLSRGDEDNIHLAGKILLDNMTDPPSLSRLARMAGVNEFKLKRGFRQVFGMTPFDYLRGARLDQAKRHLEEGRMNVCEACLAVGYSNQGHFCGAFKRRFGVTPGGVRQSALRRA